MLLARARDLTVAASMLKVVIAQQSIETYYVHNVAIGDMANQFQLKWELAQMDAEIPRPDRVQVTQNSEANEVLESIINNGDTGSMMTLTQALLAANGFDSPSDLHLLVR